MGGFYADAGDFLSNVSGAGITAYYADGSGATIYEGQNYSLLTSGTFQIATVANTQFSGMGFVSEFVFTAVPEPSISILLCLAGAVLTLGGGGLYSD